MKRNIIFAPLILLLFSVLISGCDSIPNPFQKETKPAESEIIFETAAPKTFTDQKRIDINDALQEAILAKGEQVLAFLLYDVMIDHIDVSSDEQWALVWLALVDKDTNEILPAEAGLAIALLQTDAVSGVESWRIILQADEDWNQILNQIPEELLDEDTRSKYIEKIQAAPHDGTVYTGYRLPWEAGQSKRLTGSIGHVFTYKTCPSTCLYAFDFADGTMFPIVAAKAGTVKYAVWQYDNGNTKHTNYLILEDVTTSPTTYQIYYHLAKDSIPVELRTPGTYVYQGQFIANVDDTGVSTGHHLHFHVHADPYAYWGRSVDIVFDEVDINGGRPRTCTEASAYPSYGSECNSGNLFESRNGDAEPPTGDITSPDVDDVIYNPTMVVEGYGEDDRGISYIQVMYTYDGDWYPIGNLINSTPFSAEVDLCEAGIPDGDFFISLQLMDESGKISEGFPGMRRLIKSYECPGEPPACEPSAAQVSLYSETDYEGDCIALEIGEYASPDLLTNVGDNNTASIQVGAGVVARLYEGESFSGTEETLLKSLSSMESSAVAADQLSSIVVESRPNLPAAAVLSAPLNENGETPDAKTDITLRWDAVEGSESYRSVLSGPGGLHMVLDWQSETTWHVGVLDEGVYSWSVWTKNVAGETESSIEFTIGKPSLSTSSALVPSSDGLSSSAIHLAWVVNEGEEEIDYFEIQAQEGDAEWQDWLTDISADNREAWFLGTPGLSYNFRLRSVDIYGNLEAFPDAVELSVAVPETCIADDYEGGSGNADNKWTGANPLELDVAHEHNFCGLEDVDWVMFVANAGQNYLIRSEPVSGGAAVNMQLYGFDGYNLLGEVSAANLNEGTSLEWTAPEDNVYYLRIDPVDSRLMGTDAKYSVIVERTAEMNPLSMLCAAVILPFFWLIFRVYQKMRAKETEGDDTEE